MGYTLVTAFDRAFDDKLRAVLAKRRANKIPFGRDCDREWADRTMGHHMTLLHWAKELDPELLPLADRIGFEPFDLKVTGTELTDGEEDSLVLYFSVEPGEGFAKAMKRIERTMGLETSSFLHITIAVSKDREHIRDLKAVVDKGFRYPFSLKVTELELYHIWRPVTLARSFRAETKADTGKRYL